MTRVKSGQRLPEKLDAREWLASLLVMNMTGSRKSIAAS